MLVDNRAAKHRHLNRRCDRGFQVDGIAAGDRIFLGLHRAIEQHGLRDSDNGVFPQVDSIATIKE